GDVLHHRRGQDHDGGVVEEGGRSAAQEHDQPQTGGAQSRAQARGLADQQAEQARQFYGVGDDEEAGERDDGGAGEGRLDLDGTDDAHDQQGRGRRQGGDVGAEAALDEDSDDKDE